MYLPDLIYIAQMKVRRVIHQQTQVAGTIFSLLLLIVQTKESCNSFLLGKSVFMSLYISILKDWFGFLAFVERTVQRKKIRE